MNPWFHNPSSLGKRPGPLAAACGRTPLFAMLAFGLACGRAVAALPADWRFQQQFKVDAPGLVRMSLPPETLDAARPALEDLRLYDDAGHELPFLIQRPVPRRNSILSPRSFQVSLARTNTVVTIETGLTEPLSAITLETPARTFIKAVSLEGSQDGERWESLAQGQPIFRQDAFAGRTELPGPSGSWKWLRLTLDDERSPPIPITGARLRTQTAAPLPSDPLPVSIIARQEGPGETRLTLDLGAANLHLTEVQIEADDPLFTRLVRIAVQRLSGNVVQDQILAQAAIYRVALEGHPALSNLTLPFDIPVPARHAFLMINNQDSPPLHITAVRARRRPVYLVFLPDSAGVHHLLTGNKRCAPAAYDLAALGPNLQGAPVTPVQISSIEPNPNYRSPEVLPEIREAGTALDTSAWRFRKPISVTKSGPQQVELDLDVLSRARAGFEDLRLVRAGQQLPYILERGSGNRSLALTVTTGRTEDRQLSRWILKLPRASLPVTALRCDSQDPLFQRDLVLSESLTNELGEPYIRTLGRASWLRAPGNPVRELRLPLDSPPQTDTLLLETSNGDNPPIHLEKFQADYPVTRLLFKADAGGNLFLFYGQPDSSAPRYDLSLVAGQLLSAEKMEALPGEEEPLTTSGRLAKPGKGGVLFWGVLALVVCGLLAIISRLLPKTSEV